MKMKTKTKTKIAMLVLVSASVLLTQAAVAKPLKVYLHRQVKINGDIILLGDITTMFGDAVDKAKAAAIKLGRFSLPGQVITVSRSTIQSRLTANNIGTEKVTLSGAKAISVGRNEMKISSKEITAKADIFLKENKPNPAVAYY
jgi:hypothetical protein